MRERIDDILLNCHREMGCSHEGETEREIQVLRESVHDRLMKYGMGRNHGIKYEEYNLGI